MNNSKFLAALVSIGVLTAPPAALAYDCTGAVRGVSVESGGDVLVESIGAISWPRLCNIRATMNGVAPEVCKAMYGTLLAAQANGKTITIWSSDTTKTCGTLIQWQFVNGLYLLRVDG